MTVAKVSNLLYTGLPADSKPAADTGARFYQTDAGGTFIDKVYWYNGSAWLLDAAAMGGNPSAIGPGEARPTVTATIADGQSLSAAVDIRGYRPVALIYPAGWSTASTTFQGSADNSTFNNVYDGDGNELTVPSHGGGALYQGLTAAQQLALAGVDYLKVRSGTSGSAVAQSGGDAIIVVLEPL